MSFPFEIVDMRFYFNNGKDRFTVQYSPSLFSWYVFKDREDSGCVYAKSIKKPPKIKDINFDAARDVLHEYLEPIKS